MDVPYGDFHTCPVRACLSVVPPSQLMCREHWRSVPFGLKAELHRQYRRAGRRAVERDRIPDRAYGAAATASIDAVNGMAPR